jgi:putative CocE/NonD family hydrolase
VQDGQDSYDLIEWLAVQDWCTGKVAMAGNSYLAISQWFAAAEQPPHLTAIAPWEGMSDLYRDLVMRGGMPDYAFPAMWSTSYAGNHLREEGLLPVPLSGIADIGRVLGHATVVVQRRWWAVTG